MKFLTETTRVRFNYLPYKVARGFFVLDHFRCVRLCGVCVRARMCFGGEWGRLGKDPPTHPLQEMPLKGLCHVDPPRGLQLQLSAWG